jgi:hypothetical protein
VIGKFDPSQTHSFHSASSKLAAAAVVAKSSAILLVSITALASSGFLGAVSARACGAGAVSAQT